MAFSLTASLALTHALTRRRPALTAHQHRLRQLLLGVRNRIDQGEFQFLCWAIESEAQEQNLDDDDSAVLQALDIVSNGLEGWATFNAWLRAQPCCARYTDDRRYDWMFNADHPHFRLARLAWLDKILSEMS